MNSEFDRQIKQWNKAVGLLPAEVDIEALEKQAWLVLEEAQETMEAAADNDLTELLDGLCDVYYTLGHLHNLMKMRGFDTHGAMQAVVENNELKLQLTSEEAADLAKHFAEQGQECYITTTPSGYAVQRSSDNKVMKQLNHPKVDLSKYLPQATPEEN